MYTPASACKRTRHAGARCGQAPVTFKVREHRLSKPEKTERSVGAAHYCRVKGCGSFCCRARASLGGRLHQLGVAVHATGGGGGVLLSGRPGTRRRRRGGRHAVPCCGVTTLLLTYHHHRQQVLVCELPGTLFNALALVLCVAQVFFLGASCVPASGPAQP